MGLWAAGVFSYVAYVWGISEDDRWTDVSCGSGQGCELLQGFLRWLGVLIHLSTMGLAFIFLSSFGNSVYAGRDLRSMGAIVVGMMALVVCCVLPFFVVRFDEPKPPLASLALLSVSRTHAFLDLGNVHYILQHGRQQGL